MMQHTGPARVFDAESEAERAIYENKIKLGDIVVIRAVGTLKSISDRQLFREYPSIKQKLCKGELWEDEYFA